MVDEKCPLMEITESHHAPKAGAKQRVPYFRDRTKAKYKGVKSYLLQSSGTTMSIARPDPEIRFSNMRQVIFAVARNRHRRR